MPIEHRHSHLRRVDAAAEVVWEVVSDHGGMVRWLPFGMSLLEVYGQGYPHGVGAIRSLTSARDTIVERITAFDGVQLRTRGGPSPPPVSGASRKSAWPRSAPAAS